MSVRHVSTALLLLGAMFQTATAAPPEVPGKLPAKVGQAVIFDVKADGTKEFSYAPGFDKSKCSIVRLFSDDPATASFMAIPNEAGDYYITFWSRGDKEKGYAQLVIQATGGAIPPPKKPDDPPVVVPPIPAALYFVVVGADGPVNPAVTKSLQLPEWATLALRGHMYKYKTATEAAALGIKLPAQTTLPCVVVLQNRADGKSTQRGTAPLPTSGSDVLTLPELFK